MCVCLTDAMLVDRGSFQEGGDPGWPELPAADPGRGRGARDAGTPPPTHTYIILINTFEDVYVDLPSSCTVYDWAKFDLATFLKLSM